MNRQNALKILKEGSIRQKIKLYFTDVAHFNIIGINNLDSTPSMDIVRLDYLLTDLERDSIYKSIKEKSDIKYYESLRIANIVFVNSLNKDLYMYSKDIELLSSQIGYACLYAFFKKNNQPIRTTKTDKFNPVMKKHLDARIKKLESDDSVTNLISELNEVTAEAKYFIVGVKLFLKERLPIQLYKDRLKEYEAEITKNIDLSIQILQMINRENEVTKYKDIEIELQEQDIQEIRTMIE